MKIQEVQRILGTKLVQRPDLSSVMMARGTYAVDEKEDIIGLNLSGQNLGDEQITFMWSLNKLQILNLSENKLQSLSVPGGMINLRLLDVSENTSLAQVEFAEGLPNLEKLNVSECQLKQLSLPAGFTSLHTLEAQKNKLDQFGIGENCEALNLVDLSGNELQEIVLPASMPNLQLLYLQGGNKIGNIDDLRKATGLETLNLAGNEVTDISPIRHLLSRNIPFRWEDSGNGVLLQDCPVRIPGPEIVKEGNTAIQNYFEEQDSQGTDTIYEAKLLIVGEGGAGKTSLCRRILDSELPLPNESESTKGIDIHQYSFRMQDGGEFKVNMWDFGGQEIYHATHQFFLTKRSLYILVDDTRKDYKSVHDEGFKYWLEVVSSLSGQSPVLIFQNEKTGRSKAIDWTGITSRFGNVKDRFGGDLIDPSSIDKIKKAIAYQVQILPHIGEQVPKKWLEIRRELEALAQAIPYISKEEYLNIYSKHLERDDEKALLLSQYFHDLGVFLHFQDDIWLSDIVILQNTWATEAVFKILDDEIIKANRGQFESQDCKRLWNDSIYANKHAQLLALMLKFELAYQLADTSPPIWLAPQLLPPEKPPVLSRWNRKGDLQLRYEYDFMPKGLINRLMVRKHIYVRKPELGWKSGVFFDWLDAQLLCEIAPKGDEIILRARGPQKKELLSSIAADLEMLNESFPGLTAKVTKWIPCNCKECLISITPASYPYQRLMKYKNDNRLTIECPESYEQMSVYALLDGISVGHKSGHPGMGSREADFGIESEIEGLKTELEKLIQLKNRLSEELISSYDPSQAFALENKVEKLEKSIEEKRQKLQDLAQRIGVMPPGTRENDIKNVDRLLDRTDDLKTQLADIRKKVDEGFISILSKLREQDRKLIKIMSLSETATRELAEIFQLVDANGYDSKTMERIAEDINSLIEHNKADLPAEIKSKWDDLEAEDSGIPGVKNSFKLRIAIVPGLIHYEKELNWNVRSLAKRIWSDLKAGKVFTDKGSQD